MKSNCRTRIFINPIVKPIRGCAKRPNIENSASIAFLSGIVERYEKVSLSALELTMESKTNFKIEKIEENFKYADSYLLQHGADILDGTLFIDKIKEWLNFEEMRNC